MFEEQFKFKCRKDKNLYDSELEVQTLIQSKLKNTIKKSEIPRYIDRYILGENKLEKFFENNVIKDLLSSEIRELLGLEKSQKKIISIYEEIDNNEIDNDDVLEDKNDDEIQEEKIEDSWESSESFSI
ncbi:hypothetical protein DMUE_4682 [Dictyocoela muelleri]|nr:hypothetical protein DMUE_4682 [Dictyocoela muelleri]